MVLWITQMYYNWLLFCCSPSLAEVSSRESSISTLQRDVYHLAQLSLWRGLEKGRLFPITRFRFPCSEKSLRGYLRRAIFFHSPSSTIPANILCPWNEWPFLSIQLIPLHKKAISLPTFPIILDRSSFPQFSWASRLRSLRSAYITERIHEPHTSNLKMDTAYSSEIFGIQLQYYKNRHNQDSHNLKN
jgi:hypothetical protein